MKWLGFIALVLIESLAIFGLSLEKIGFTIPQTILILCYVVLLIITITGFIIAHFVNLQKERENEFGILIRELREIKEIVGTSETRVIKLESLIENDVRNDIEKVYINVFRVLVEKLRGQEEAIKTVKEQVFRIGQNVLISEEKLEDIKEEFKRLK